MSLKDVIYKMSRHLIETCESSEDLRLKQTGILNLCSIIPELQLRTHYSIDNQITQDTILPWTGRRSRALFKF